MNWINKGAVALTLLCSTLLAQAQLAQPCGAKNGPTYLTGTERDKRKTSVVVFVHGVLSNSVDAWAYNDRTTWPCLLLQEPAFKSSNVFLYAYHTAANDESPSIDKVASQLRRDMLTSFDVLQHAHITIVAHSMGGLVVSRMLLQLQRDPDTRRLLDRVKLVMFYGTPAKGAEIANVASVLSPNVQFEEMRVTTDPSNLLHEWSAVQWPFHWYCLAEGKKTGWSWLVGTQVVDRDSARALCANRPEPAFDVLEGFDHISLVKPDSVYAAPHLHLRRAFKSCVSKSIGQAGHRAAPVTPDEEASLRMLSSLVAHFGDETEEARTGDLQLVQDALYKSTGWTDQYFLPKRSDRGSLAETDHEQRTSRVFANEFITFLRHYAGGAKRMWVSPVNVIEEALPDGQVLELLSRWKQTGMLDDRDFAIALELPNHPATLLVFAGLQNDDAGNKQARVRGFVMVPPEPRTCI